MLKSKIFESNQKTNFGGQLELVSKLDTNSMDNGTFILPVMWFSYSKLSSEIKMTCLYSGAPQNNTGAKMLCI